MGRLNDAPSRLWHEAHPGRLGSTLAPCWHPVVKATEAFLYVAAHCGTLPGRKTTRIRRDELAAGVGVDAWVCDRDGGGAFKAAAWFFEGTVPPSPIRPPGWLRARRRAEADAARADEPARPPYYTPPEARVADAADLAALGLRKRPDAAGLQRAWRETAKRVHPDAGGTDAAFVAARAAYERLRAVCT